MAEIKLNKSWKSIISWLMKNKIINNQGEVNNDKVELFIKNYDENITNRTIRN